MIDNPQLIHYFILLGGRYFFFAGLSFLLFYVIFNKASVKKRIQKKFPKTSDYYREIGYSLLTAIIFSITAYLILQTSFKNYTLVYDTIDEFGIPYFILSFFLIIFLHDTYFYWMHRFMHHPKVYKWVHLIHHKSTNPSPWASYAFHPFEAVLEAGILLLVVFLFPVHKLALSFFILFMIIYNVYGHLGYEIYPYWLLKSKVGKWLNTSTNHNMHHEFFVGNYGLYFRFWDEIMGTTHPNYNHQLEKFK